MTVQTAIDDELPFLRAEAEARMIDTCRITKPGAGKGARNPETGKYDPPDPVLVYEGACRIPRKDASGAQVAAAGEATWQVGEYPLALPMSAAATADVAVGMTVEYLTSVDPALVGRSFGITGIERQTQATARRFRMKEVVGS